MHKGLKDAIAKDNLVLFVGAGMSMSLGFPSWKNLVIEILKDLQEELGDNPKFNFSYYESLGDTIDVFEVLDDLERCDLKQRAEKSLYKKLKRIDFSSESLERHEKLWKISSNIITTNYDKVLEKVKPEHIEAYSNKNVFQQSLSLQGSPYLYKIHGDISDVESCILFTSDYENLYSDENPNKETLKHFFMGKTILFLGFSLEDPFIIKQLKYIENLYNGYSNTHYLISKANKEFKGLNVDIIPIEDWGESFDEKLDELIAFKKENESTLPTIRKEEDSVDISKETDLVKLRNIFEEKKKDIEDVDELEMKKAYRELSKISERIQELQAKELDFHQQIPEHNQYKLEYIFEEIFSSEKLSPKLIREITEVKDQYSNKNEWYHRSVLVSALACSIVNSKKLDPKKLEFLIDFTNDSEDKVWQKAITYLFLVLNHLGNKWLQFKGILQPKLKGLQEKSKIQKALKAIIAFMQFDLQGVSPVNEKIFENEYFKDSPFNYFLPFYKDNPSVENVYEDDTIGDVEEHIKNLYNSPLSDAFKYLICNTQEIFKNDEKIETKEEENRSKKIVSSIVRMHHFFEPYINYVNDFLNFYQNYPKSLKEIKQEITVTKITKLKNVLLNTVEEHRVLARQFMLQKEWGIAITHYEALLKIEDEDKDALLNLIKCYDNTKKSNDDKLKIRLQIEELFPKDDDNLYEIGVIYRNFEKNKTALKYINRAISINDKNYNYYYVRGIVKGNLGHNKEALSNFNKAIELGLEEAGIYFNRGLAKGRLEDHDEAILAFDKALELGLEEADLYYSRGFEKKKLKRYKEAILDFDKALEYDIKEMYYEERGDCKYELKDYVGALKDYQKNMKLNAKNLNHHLNLCKVHVKLNNLEKAHKICDKASKLGIKNGSDLGTKAAIYASEGNDELFYEYIEKAFQVKAKASWLYDDIKEKYKDEKRFQELLAKYNQTLEDED